MTFASAADSSRAALKPQCVAISPVGRNAPLAPIAHQNRRIAGPEFNGEGDLQKFIYIRFGVDDPPDVADGAAALEVSLRAPGWAAQPLTNGIANPVIALRLKEKTIIRALQQQFIATKEKVDRPLQCPSSDAGGIAGRCIPDSE